MGVLQGALLALIAPVFGAMTRHARDEMRPPHAPSWLGKALRAHDKCMFVWGAWSPCSERCGGGAQHRRARVIREPRHGARRCPAPQQRLCNTARCLPTPAPTPPTPAPTPTPPTPRPTLPPTPRPTCPAGRAGNAVHRTCSRCAVGQWAHRGAHTCRACAAGRYGQRVAETSARCGGLCPRGRHSRAGSAVCSPCDSGHYSSRLGSGMCRACPAGKYQPNFAASKCVACAHGRSSPRGSEECRLVFAGRRGAKLLVAPGTVTQRRVTQAPRHTHAPSPATPTPPPGKLCHAVAVVGGAARHSGRCAGALGVYTLYPAQLRSDSSHGGNGNGKGVEYRLNAPDGAEYVLFRDSGHYWFVSRGKAGPPYCLAAVSGSWAPYEDGVHWTASSSAGGFASAPDVRVMCATPSPSPYPTVAPTPRPSHAPSAAPTPAPTPLPTNRTAILLARAAKRQAALIRAEAHALRLEKRHRHLIMCSAGVVLLGTLAVCLTTRVVQRSAVHVPMGYDHGTQSALGDNPDEESIPFAGSEVTPLRTPCDYECAATLPVDLEPLAGE